MLNARKCWVILPCLLAGCAVFAKAPKPTECQGEYRPINVVEQKGASFDGSGRIARCDEGRSNGQHS